MCIWQRISIIIVLALFFYEPLNSMDFGTINLQDELGYTKLHKATSLEDALELLKQGADANLKNRYGDTGCHVIMRMSFDKPTATTKTILEYLVDKADFGIQNNIGNTPFHSLIRCGNMNICSSLIKSIQDMRTTLFYSMQASKTLLLIYNRKGKFVWLPKAIVLMIIHNMVSNTFSVCREKYIQLNLNHILMKKNNQKKRVEHLAERVYITALVELKNIKKHKKEYSELDYKNSVSAQYAYITTIKEIKQLLNPKLYA